MKLNELEIPKQYFYKYIAVFLTMRCNLNCSFCINSFEKNGEFNRVKFKELSGEEWVEALNRIESQKDIPLTLCGGEPFLHKDFIYIINNIKPELRIDILTNLQWGSEGIDNFIKEVDPERLNRNAPYPPIRISYHPEQMNNGEKLVKDAKRLQDAGFKVGIYSVLYPSPKQLEAINQMQFRCAEEGILFRLKEFLGEYNGELYGDYSRFCDSVNSSILKTCLCRTSELIIGPNGNVYKCHRDLYNEENPIGHVISPKFKIEYEFRRCNKFGECNPCDVKIKTDNKQNLGHTSVEIKDIN